MDRILAIDYGSRRVGIAVTDPCRIIVTPLQTVYTKDIMSFLDEYMQVEKVEVIVVGMPRKLDGGISDFSLVVKSFIRSLKKKNPQKIIFEYDERFTSKIATQALISCGFSRKDRHNKANIDMISAAIILESFLDQYGWNFGVSESKN